MLYKYVSKKYVFIAVAIIIGFALIHIVQVVNAGTDEPGSDADPLITKSYIDHKIGILTDRVESFFKHDDQLTAAVDVLNKKITELETQLKLTLDTSTAKVEVIELKKGQQIIARNSTEIVLRSGSAKGIASSLGGIADLTAGKGTDIKTDGNIPINHLLLIPRDDGRGIKITSNNAWVLLKGQYSVK